MGHECVPRGRVRGCRDRRPRGCGAAACPRLRGVEAGSGCTGDPLVFSHTTESFIIGQGYTTLGSVRGPRWKYILRPDDGSEELYDLESDPEERTDLGDSEHEIRERYRGALEEWLSGGTPRSETRGLDDKALEKLRALGYIR